jgi:hypothetical protein
MRAFEGDIKGIQTRFSTGRKPKMRGSILRRMSKLAEHLNMVDTARAEHAAKMAAADLPPIGSDIEVPDGWFAIRLENAVALFPHNRRGPTPDEYRASLAAGTTLVEPDTGDASDDPFGCGEAGIT